MFCSHYFLTLPTTPHYNRQVVNCLSIKKGEKVMPLQFVQTDEERGKKWLAGKSLDSLLPRDLRSVYLSAEPPYSQRDEYSRMEEPELAKLLKPADYALIAECFPLNLTRRRSAMRWVARGVDRILAIVKVFCDLEVSVLRNTNHDQQGEPAKGKKGRKK
jgi:hypothetical protein